MKKFLHEFRTFAMRGNVVDMAVGIVIGAAFGKIVSSLVANIITPLISFFAGGVDVTYLEFTMGDSAVTYGVFIQSIIDFVIVAFAIFVVIKAMNKFREKEDEEGPEKPKKPSEEVELLREIRDSLKK